MASDDELRELVIIRRLRVATVLACICGLVAFGLGFIEVEFTDVDYHPRSERASDAASTLCVIAALVPAAFVYRRPRWPQLATWMIVVACCAALWLVSSFVGDRAPPASVPATVGRITLLLMIGAVVVLVVMPLIRLGHKSPPLVVALNLPRARIISDGK
jgi:amino acid transporter